MKIHLNEWTWRDPFAGDISGVGETLEEAIAESYRGIPEAERPHGCGSGRPGSLFRVALAARCREEGK